MVKVEFKTALFDDLILNRPLGRDRIENPIPVVRNNVKNRIQDLYIVTLDNYFLKKASL